MLSSTAVLWPSLKSRRAESDKLAGGCFMISLASHARQATSVFSCFIGAHTFVLLPLSSSVISRSKLILDRPSHDPVTHSIAPLVVTTTIAGSARHHVPDPPQPETFSAHPASGSREKGKIPAPYELCE